jgi:hypothetical protein
MLDEQLADLTFLLEGRVTGRVRANVRAMVARLCETRRWPTGAPRVLDDEDTSSCFEPHDRPVARVGCVLSIPASATACPLRDLQDASVHALAHAMSLVAREAGCDLLVEIDGELIGRIDLLDRRAHR